MGSEMCIRDSCSTVLVGTRPVTHVVHRTERSSELAIVGPDSAVEAILQPQHAEARQGHWFGRPMGGEQTTLIRARTGGTRVYLSSDVGVATEELELLPLDTTTPAQKGG